MIPAKSLDYHSFLPSRSPVQAHAFSDALRCLEYERVDLKGMIQVLVEFYLTKDLSSSDAVKRSQQHCQRVLYIYGSYWQSKTSIESLPFLYFTLLLNQYMVSRYSCLHIVVFLYCSQIIQPKLRAFWVKFLPCLRTQTMQTRLLNCGCLSLCMKINSHWIFSDMVYRIDDATQPEHCLPEEAQDSNQVDSLVGMSPKLLKIFADTTKYVAKRQWTSSGQSPLLHEAQRLQQCYPANSALDGLGRRMMSDIGGAYAQTAIIYILCRLQRYYLSL